MYDKILVLENNLGFSIRARFGNLAKRVTELESLNLKKISPLVNLLGINETHELILRNESLFKSKDISSRIKIRPAKWKSLWKFLNGYKVLLLNMSF